MRWPSRLAGSVPGGLLRPRRLSLALLVPLAAGCLMETVGGGRPDLAWDRGVVFHDTGSYHGVTVHVEVDPEREIPKGYVLQGWMPPERQGAREIYRYFGHEITYANGRWEVGEHAYTAPRGRSSLYVLRPRNDLEFEFRGQRIRVESPRRWTPAVFRSREDGWEELPTRRGRRTQRRPLWSRDVLRVGLATIELDSRRPGIWLVNGDAYRPLSERVLILRGAVRAAGT